MRSVFWMVAGAVLGLALAVGGVRAADELMFKPGNYEITAELKMPGILKGKGQPPETSTQCLTREKPVPAIGKDRTEDCRMGKVKVKGASVLWEMACEGDKEASGKVTFKDDAVSGELKVELDDEMHMTYLISGRRVGDCQ